MSRIIHVLVIDCEPDWSNFVAGVLAEAGYRVVTRTDVPTASDEMSQQRPDLIVADASLRSIAEKLPPAFSHVRFVVFTASPSVGEALTAYRAGALDYANKAFDRKHVLTTVQAALQKPRATRISGRSPSLSARPV